MTSLTVTACRTATLGKSPHADRPAASWSEGGFCVLEVISPAADRVAKAVAFTHYFGLSRRPASLLVVLYEGRHAHHPGESLAVLTLTTPRAIQGQLRQLKAQLLSA